MSERKLDRGRISLVLALAGGTLLVLVLAGGRFGSPVQAPPDRSYRLGSGLFRDALDAARFLNVRGALPAIETEGHSPVPSAISTPAGYSASNSGATLIFAHVADGRFQFGAGRRFMQTTFNLVNDSSQPVTGTLSFFKAAGLEGSPGVPMQLTVDGTTGSQFQVQIPARTTKRLVTSGDGDLQAGWAEFRANQAVAGAAGFSTRDSAGRIYSDVGVAESVLARHFTVFADSKGQANTGIALVNPSPTQLIVVGVELRRSDGTSVIGFSRLLPPRHHTALFLDELFQGVPGIAEFEGSVVLQSEDPFAGITLRTVGSQLTSVPMVTLPDPREDRQWLVFPHVADGLEGGIRIVTSVLLFNNTAIHIKGAVNFVKSDGLPMTVTVGGRTASDFSFDLSPGAVTRLVTRGTGAFKVGWVEVTMDGPVSGTAIYQIQDASGATISEVGVGSAPAPSQVNLIADSPGVYRTGLALANRTNSTQEVRLELYDSAGTRRKTASIYLESRQHRAGFLDEEGFFKGTSGIENWQGRVAVRIDNAGRVAVLTLRQAGLLTTSVPTVSPVRPFVPVAVLTPSQNLTSSSPALRLAFGQVQGELAMDQIEVSVPGLGLTSGSVKAGEDLAYGTFLLSSGSLSIGGIAKMICTGTSPLTFDLAVSMEGLRDQDASIVLASGVLEGRPSSDFRWVIGPLGAPPLDWNRNAGLELDLTLRDGLALSPTQARTIQATHRLTSVSTKPTGEAVRLVRSATHPLAFQAKAAGAPFVESIRPIFVAPGGRLTLTGGNFGAQPQVRFDGPEGAVEDVLPELLSATSLESFSPGDVPVSGVTVTSGAQEGNAVRLQSVFAPVSEVEASGAPDAGPFSVSMQWDQAGRQLRPAGIGILLYGVDWPVPQGDEGAEAGSMTFSGGPGSDQAEEFRVLIDAVDDDAIDLSVVDEDDEITGSITVRRLGEDGGVGIAYAPAEVQEVPTVHGHPFAISLQLGGLVFPKLPPGNAAFWTVEGESLPADLVGAGTGVRSMQSVRRLQ